eukprot:15472804-Alexandrium_andersonii.AAC.1
MADCGLGRIGALTGLGRIADCIFGALRCKDARMYSTGGVGRAPARGHKHTAVLQTVRSSLE